MCCNSIEAIAVAWQPAARGKTRYYAPSRHDTGSTTARSVDEVALIQDTLSRYTPVLIAPFVKSVASACREFFQGKWQRLSHSRVGVQHHSSDRNIALRPPARKTRQMADERD